MPENESRITTLAVKHPTAEEFRQQKPDGVTTDEWMRVLLARGEDGRKR